MKTNREMTDSVLHKASKVAAQQKQTRRRAAGILTGALCMALLLGLLFQGVGQHTDPTLGQFYSSPTTESDPVQPTQPTQDDVSTNTGAVYFLSSSDQADMLTPLKTNMTYAVEQRIRVFPKKAEKAANEFYNNWVLKYEEIAPEGARATWRSNKTVIYALSAGVTSVILPDYTQIIKVERESAGVLTCGGTYSTHDNDYTFTNGDRTITIPSGSYRVYLNFSPSTETIALLDNAPDTPLSTIRDTFTLTVHYKNGTAETLTFDVFLDDEGQVYTSLLGVSAV